MLPAGTVAGYLLGALLDRWLHTYLDQHCWDCCWALPAALIELIRTDLARHGIERMSDNPVQPEPVPQEPGYGFRVFYSGALDRIRNFMLVLGVVLPARGLGYFRDSMRRWDFCWDA